MAEKKPSHFLLVCMMLAACVLLGDNWGLRFLLAPLQHFTIAVHELGHALSCLLTGGSVSGLTIVDDSQGHGGLTFTRGGWWWLVPQMGYLGTTITGCLLLLLSNQQRYCRPVLFVLGLAMAFCTLVLMPGTIFSQGRLGEGLGSMAWGLLMAGMLMAGSFRLPPTTAQWVVIFISAYTALNAVSSSWGLAVASWSGRVTWSDATNMASLTGIPAVAWSALWVLLSILMVSGTLRHIYRTEHAVTT